MIDKLPNINQYRMTFSSFPA